MSFRDLTVYKKAFSLAMDIFHESKNFPKEEIYSLTEEIEIDKERIRTIIENKIYRIWTHI